jgi:hypothetical protein
MTAGPGARRTSAGGRRSGDRLADRPASDRSGYLAESERPWGSLCFLLPLMAVYGLYAAGVIGAQSGGPPANQHITAFLLVEELFEMLGATGRHLPAVALAVLLLIGQVARKNPWTLHVSTLIGMAAESLFWGLPLVVLGWVMARYLPLAGSGTHGNIVVLALGAGIYEEMLFRLIGVNFLNTLLRKGFGLPRSVAIPSILILSGVGFSLYHYLSPSEQFAWRPFLFRTLAGGYFGLLYLLRGFGVTAGSHSAYDLIVVTILAT